MSSLLRVWRITVLERCCFWQTSDTGLASSRLEVGSVSPLEFSHMSGLSGSLSTPWHGLISHDSKSWSDFSIDFRGRHQFLVIKVRASSFFSSSFPLSAWARYTRNRHSVLLPSWLTLSRTFGAVISRVWVGWGFPRCLLGWFLVGRFAKVFVVASCESSHHTPTVIDCG